MSILLIIFGIYSNELAFVRSTNTYGNFDTPGTESWVMKLQPGIADYASRVEYGKFHSTPLIAIFILFIVTLLISIYRLKRDLIQRKIIQWLFFVLARFGVFRVSGLCPIKRSEFGVFPFLNCQACEMATGACPIGMIQWALMRGKTLYLVSGTLMLFGSLLGRFICGWLCPFGFFADILDRFSKRKLSLPNSFKHSKFIILAALPTAFLWPIPFFCVYICQSGNIFGRLPYYLTTGLPGLKEAFASSGWYKTILLYQIISLVVLFVAGIIISGRWFCRYFCPLGAFLGLFNYISPIKVVHNDSKCTNCNACTKHCPMEVDLKRGSFTDITGCIKCGKCTKLCNARKFHLPLKKTESNEK